MNFKCLIIFFKCFPPPPHTAVVLVRPNIEYYIDGGFSRLRFFLKTPNVSAVQKSNQLLFSTRNVYSSLIGNRPGHATKSFFFLYLYVVQTIITTHTLALIKRLADIRFMVYKQIRKNNLSEGLK